MKHNFYAPPESVSDSLITFPESEAYHANRVLRVKSGDEVAVVDGAGNWYRVTLEVLGRKSVVGQILEHRANVGEPQYQLHLMVGILKNLNRFETMIEKAVELGTSEITPLITQRSEKGRIKTKRAETIITSAMKQSGRSCLTQLNVPVKFKKWLKQLPEETSELRIVCHEAATPDQNLGDLLQSSSATEKVTIMIGPEGGISPDEIEQLKEKGFQMASLGPRRLRTETAAIVAASMVMLSNYRERPL